MKLSRLDVHGKAIDSLVMRFEAQHLTSFSGLVIFQRFFLMLQLKERLWRCFRHLRVSAIYGHHVIMMVLVVHLLLGYRELRDVRLRLGDLLVTRSWLISAVVMYGLDFLVGRAGIEPAII